MLTVPVLPATGVPAVLSRVPVPEVTTVFIRLVIRYADWTDSTRRPPSSCR